MLKKHKVSEQKNQSSTLSEDVVHGKKNLKLMEVNYRRNTDSDYTEQIEALYNNFDYSSNSDRDWVEPELSILYGSPIYEAASPSQKQALNHLLVVFHYNAIAATETNTIFYNQVTSSVFFRFDDYKILCQELDVETSQERYHINAFHTIGNKTELALMGETVFGRPRSTPSSEINQEELQLLHQGLAGRSALGPVALRPLNHLYPFSLTNSPFLASHYYALRGTGNLHLKNKENSFCQYFKQLENKGELIPAPTAVSRLHFLDEAFHTATSQLISHELYKDFPQPTAYEKFMANLAHYTLQRNALNGISCAVPGEFVRDGDYVMALIYKLLQTALFGMSSQEALVMMEKCFCYEHEGFHVAAKYHQHLLSDLRKFLEGLDYLWPVNREMRLMASAGSISKAIQTNIKDFKRFSRSVAA